MKKNIKLYNVPSKIKKISVIGASEPDEDQYNVAYELGKFLAKKNYVIVCGGRTGVMEAVCKGAKEVGGLTVGILPTLDESSANPYVDIRIPTGLGWLRNPLVVLASDKVIAIGGAYGTLSEISYAYMFEKDLVGYKTWDIVEKNFKDKEKFFKYLEEEFLKWNFLLGQVDTTIKIGLK